MLAALAALSQSCGWLVVAIAFRAEIDCRRLRLDGSIVATSYIAVVAAEVLRLASTVGRFPEADGKLASVASALRRILIAAGRPGHRLRPRRFATCAAVRVTTAVALAFVAVDARSVARLRAALRLTAASAIGARSAT